MEEVAPYRSFILGAIIGVFQRLASELHCPEAELCSSDRLGCIERCEPSITIVLKIGSAGDLVNFVTVIAPVQAEITSSSKGSGRSMHHVGIQTAHATSYLFIPKQ
jgi:hypothetical protein